MVQHLNHETAIHQLQASHAEELRMVRQEAEDARRTEYMQNRFDLKVGKPDVWNPDKDTILGVGSQVASVHGYVQHVHSLRSSEHPRKSETRFDLFRF